MVGARHRSFIIAIGLFFLMIPLFSYAQTGTQVLINYPEVIEGDNQDQLGIYFNITDSQGKVQTDADVSAATILLDDGVRYTAEVEQPTSPIYITLVLDASGSMGRAAPIMREAAIQAVESAPEEAQFMVIRFNDQIDHLTEEFTADRVAAIEAINQVESVNLAGTCLYDATIEGINVLAQAPPGRRALILFTDGRDEKLVAGSTSQFEPCSRSNYDEVVDLANRPESRTPIHTIGMSAQGAEDRINGDELREMAAATGGTSAIGNQEALSALFQQIMDALKAQWLASAQICPLAGSRTAQLFVTIGESVFPQPSVTFFTINQDCILATPTPEPTIPVEVQINVQSIQLDIPNETVSLEVSVPSGEERVTEYLFEFKNADSNLLLGSFSLQKPLPLPVVFPTRALGDGEILVVISAFDENRQIISRTEDRFVYTAPTATPLPPTPTPAPIGATLESIEFDESSNSLDLNVSLASPDQISELQVNVINENTNLLEKTYPGLPVNASVTLGNIDTLPPGEYIINLIAKGASGQIITQSDLDFTYAPAVAEPGSATINNFQIDREAKELALTVEMVNAEQIDTLQIDFVNTRSNVLALSTTAQPAETIQLDITALPPGEYNVSVLARDANQQPLTRTSIPFTYEETTTLIAISAVTFDEASSEFTVQIDTENEQAINQYRLRLVDEATRLQSAEFTFDTPPHSPLKVDVTDKNLKEGKYNLVLDALGEGGQLLSTATYEGAVYTPPPGPSLIEKITTNPVILGVIALVMLFSGVTLIRMMRPARRQTATPILQEMTMMQKIPVAAPPQPKAGKASAPVDNEKTTVLPAMAKLPVATLNINKSEDAGQTSRLVIIAKVPFIIGRSGEGLSLADSSISRQHAEITYQDGTFYIMDMGSANGTYVDERRISTQTPTPLTSGQVIRIGGTTELLFKIEGKGR